MLLSTACECDYSNSIQSILSLLSVKSSCKNVSTDLIVTFAAAFDLMLI